MTSASLICPDCGATFPDRWRCPCGSPLNFQTNPIPESASPPDPATFDVRSGIWSFEEFLPVGDDPADRVSFGAGPTPLVDADPGRPNGIDTDVGDGVRDDTAGPEEEPWNCRFKLEYVLPTGSFKDRGATTTLTRARELGIDRLCEDSSGNAGTAIATYAARAGIDAEIYLPASAATATIRAIERVGATPVPVEGNRGAATEACIDAVESGAGWYASHAWNPAFHAGTATFAHEIALQSDWQVPDAVVIPVGHGTLFLGAYLGFERLEEAGWIDRVPRLLAAQAAGNAPVVRELHGEDAASRGGDNDVAKGIRIADPPRIDGILDAIRETGGDAIAVTESATRTALERLGRHGFDVEATSAIAPAALREYRKRGILDTDDDVVVPLTGRD
ncbi:pyridoxal-phosphate dependent enzyme [Halopenitus sp. H-Gu1]|uniref:threonine synthase n=1 Tax=Halopenitus sp. H-Gu1 TaxID=3242697 RepID=UPI00359E182E